jgi:hypothetical protein
MSDITITYKGADKAVSNRNVAKWYNSINRLKPFNIENIIKLSGGLYAD